LALKLKGIIIYPKWPMSGRRRKSIEKSAVHYGESFFGCTLSLFAYISPDYF
jgi:hypothetical protein